MSFTVLIPARYGSSRFPGKALADLAGKPMVVRVCERAAQSGARAVHVATDDERILKVVEENGFRALTTRSDHASGTDRIAEAAAMLRLAPEEIVVNVQGDEPLIDPALVGAVAQVLEQNREASMSTACHPIRDPALLTDPNIVKVVLDARGFALYFSRSRIPHPRAGSASGYRHAGIYGYRVEFLLKFAKLAQSPLERAEALEQLRALWHGYKIAVFVGEGESAPSVDTPEDVNLVITRIDPK